VKSASSVLCGRSVRPRLPAPARWQGGLFLLCLLLAGCGLPPAEQITGDGTPIRVLTFNVGSDGDAQRPATDGSHFGGELVAVADRWYGNGLSWQPGIEAVRRFLSDVDADVVALQEIFPATRCPEIPARWHRGFVCESWQPGAPGVARRILGEAYQIACHAGKPDKCLAVHRRLGHLHGCSADGCEPLRGVELEGCGHGSRQGLGIIDLHTGGQLAIGHVHGRSGARLRDANCRKRQFSELLHIDGALHPPTPGAIILGDFNTDPARVRWLDPSARLLARAAREAAGFRFITQTGVFARPTFLSFLNIDHVLARGFSGRCTAGGRDPALQAPPDLGHLDHSPLLCELQPQPGLRAATPSAAGENTTASRYSTPPLSAP